MTGPYLATAVDRLTSPLAEPIEMLFGPAWLRSRRLRSRYQRSGNCIGRRVVTRLNQQWWYVRSAP